MTKLPEPPKETALGLLKELRDTTPMVMQRKRIDAFFAAKPTPDTDAVKLADKQGYLRGYHHAKIYYAGGQPERHLSESSGFGLTTPDRQGDALIAEPPAPTKCPQCRTRPVADCGYYCNTPAASSEPSANLHFSDCGIYDGSGTPVLGRVCTCGGAVEDKTGTPLIPLGENQASEISAVAIARNVARPARELFPDALCVALPAVEHLLTVRTTEPVMSDGCEDEGCPHYGVAIKCEPKEGGCIATIPKPEQPEPDNSMAARIAWSEEQSNEQSDEQPDLSQVVYNILDEEASRLHGWDNLSDDSFDQIEDALLPYIRAPEQVSSFQQQVQPWMQACFGPEIANDTVERNHRFIEEALELVQSCGATASECHQLVDYVFNRPVGEPHQESGGVMVTHAALCLANGLDMHENGEIELARIRGKVEIIRAKQAAKPKHSPLPEPIGREIGGDCRKAFEQWDVKAGYTDFTRDDQWPDNYSHSSVNSRWQGWNGCWSNNALDAERYRYLRSRDLETINKGGVFAGVTPDNIVLNEEDLDAAVDIAIRNEMQDTAKP